MKTKQIQFKPIPKEVKETISQMEKIEIKENELLQKHSQIVSTAPFCQHPPIAHETLDKACELNKQRTKLWNQIRNYCVNTKYETLWQLAIKSKNMPVARWGKENILNFSTKQIKELWGMKD